MGSNQGCGCMHTWINVRTRIGSHAPPPAARPYLFEADRIVDIDRWRRSTPSGQAAIDRRERLLDVLRVVVKMRGESQDIPARRHNDPGFVETLGQDPHIRAGEPGCD